MACSIYGAALICLYTASTLYHAAISPRLKRALKIFDHCAIYLLIAGTYTPFLLLNLRGAWGWSLFGVVWGLAFAGILFKFWFIDHFEYLSTAIYVAMGWMVIIAAKPVLAHVPTATLLWLLAGGSALFLRSYFLRLEALALQSRRLAPLRPRRQRVPLLCYPALPARRAHVIPLGFTQEMELNVVG